MKKSHAQKLVLWHIQQIEKFGIEDYVKQLRQRNEKGLKALKSDDLKQMVKEMYDEEINLIRRINDDLMESDDFGGYGT